MNHAARYLASSVAAVGLIGCAIDHPKESPTESSTASISFEEYKALAAREPGTGAYIVDWDIALHSEEELYAYWQQLQRGALTIYTENNTDVKWNAQQKVALTYCISNSFAGNKTAIVNAMTAATTNGWEKWGNVKFVYVPAQDANCNANNQNVLFDVNPAPAGAQYLARAFFPNSPRAERNVLFAAAAFNPQQTGGISVANIMIHELGHVLGFRHEHVRAPGYGGPGQACNEGDAANAPNYRDVTAYDVKSTMHYPQCGSPGNTLELSPLDKAGIRKVYGPGPASPPEAAITAPANNAQVDATFTVSATVDDTDTTKADLYVDGTMAQSLTAAPFTFQVSNLAAGQHTLEVRATDALNQTTNSTMVTVTVANTGGNNNGGNNNGGNNNGSNNNGGGSDTDGTDITGGCNAGGSGAGAGLAFALGAVGLVLRRRRSRA